MAVVILASQSATVSNRAISQVAVIDPHHPLYGQRFDLSAPASGHRPGWVSIVLADGRRRWVPRAATDLDADGESSTSHALPRVSVRTLLPLSQYVRTVLLNRRKVPDDAPLHPNQLDARAGSCAPPAGAGAATVAGDDADGSAAPGPASGSDAAADADGSRHSRAERGTSC
jgi:hypothetical protein